MDSLKSLMKVMLLREYRRMSSQTKNGRNFRNKSAAC